MKILLITSEYPPQGNTSAIHYFAREWVKTGNEVYVVFECSRLVFPLYLIAGQQDRRMPAGKTERYDLDGVHVLKLPLVRLIPKSGFTSPLSRMRAIRKMEETIQEWGKFDVIISHFCSNVFFLTQIAQGILKCPVVSVFHTCDTRNDALAKKIVESSSMIGARSAKIEDYLRNNISYSGNVLRVMSGVPDEYIVNREECKIKDYYRFIYVGKLIKRKNVAEMLESFSQLPPNINYHLDIIGDGLEKETLQKICADLSLTDRVSFLGAMSREEVHKRMSEADCFVMISSGETFGLVYLEALAAGCIVIGSKGEGIDGIIVNGENGFLVSPGNVNELKQRLIEFVSLNDGQYHEMMKNSHATIINLTDKETANRYLLEVKSLLQC